MGQTDPNRRHGPGDRNRQNNKPDSIFDDCVSVMAAQVAIVIAAVVSGVKLLRRKK